LLVAPHALAFRWGVAGTHVVVVNCSDTHVVVLRFAGVMLILMTDPNRNHTSFILPTMPKAPRTARATLRSTPPLLFSHTPS
jgi:hypothetical protein